MLRAECRTGTEVSDDIANRLVAEHAAQPDCESGLLLDGYPRTVTQAQALRTLVRERGWVDPVGVQLDVTESTLVERLTAREDDRERIIRQRLLLHREPTQPLLEYFGQDRIQKVDGAASPALIAQSIIEAVSQLSSRCRGI